MKNLMLFVILIAVVLSLPSIHSISINDLKWRVGDYWKYEINDFGPYNKERRYIEKDIVVGKENISFYGRNYFAYRVNINFMNQTMVAFYRVNDLAGIGEIHDNDSIISDPPMERLRFLHGYKNWNQSITWIEKVDNEIYNISFTIHYEYMGKERVKTRAGTFTCYKIKSYANDSSNFGIEYFSMEVKNIVKSVEYKNGNITTRKELIDTSYKKHGIPSFEIYLLILGISIFILIRRKK